MRPFFELFMLAALSIFAFMQLFSADSHLPIYVGGAILLVTGALAGLRIGADSAGRLVSDLSRSNRYLAEQNEELSELNYELLARLNEVVEEAGHD